MKIVLLSFLGWWLGVFFGGLVAFFGFLGFFCLAGCNMVLLFITPQSIYIPLAVSQLLDPWWFPDLQIPDQAGFKVRQDK